MDFVFGGLIILFLGMTGSSLFYLRWARRLPPLPNAPLNPESKRLRCSIVLAARNEAPRIEETIRSILGQTGVEVEVIVVDDRSTDGTGERLDLLAAEDLRVRKGRVEILPSGWLGKCHACHLGAKMATGDWILFTDADCWLRPDVIARALEIAKSQKVQHIVLTPGVEPVTTAARAWHLAFLLSLANWFSRVNQDKPKAYVGMGAFNLVERSLYERSGGYEALRLTVLDDVRLGLLLRRAGGRSRFFIGGNDVECHWGHTVPEMIKIMEKNYFAAADYRTGLVVGLGIIAVTLAILTCAAIISRTWIGIAAAAAWFTMAFPAAIFAHRLNWKVAPALMAPLIFPVLFYAVIRSAIKTLSQGGIWWRETFYPLDELRAGNVK